MTLPLHTCTVSTTIGTHIGPSHHGLRLHASSPSNKSSSSHKGTNEIQLSIGNYVSVVFDGVYQSSPSDQYILVDIQRVNYPTEVNLHGPVAYMYDIIINYVEGEGPVLLAHNATIVDKDNRWWPNCSTCMTSLLRS